MFYRIPTFHLLVSWSYSTIQPLIDKLLLVIGPAVILSNLFASSLPVFWNQISLFCMLLSIIYIFPTGWEQFEGLYCCIGWSALLELLKIDIFSLVSCAIWATVSLEKSSVSVLDPEFAVTNILLSLFHKISYSRFKIEQVQ